MWCRRRPDLGLLSLREEDFCAPSRHDDDLLLRTDLFVRSFDSFPSSGKSETEKVFFLTKSRSSVNPLLFSASGVLWFETPNSVLIAANNDGLDAVGFTLLDTLGLSQVVFFSPRKLPLLNLPSEFGFEVDFLIPGYPFASVRSVWDWDCRLERILSTFDIRRVLC